MVEESNNDPRWNKRIDELHNKDMISGVQKEAMKKMVDSPDDENFVVVEEIIKLKLEDQLAVGLNNDQTAAFKAILKFFYEGDEHAFILKGYAGTGKTFLVKRIIEYVTATFPKRKVAITAPTNKAVQVLQADTPFVDGGGAMFSDLFNQEDRLTYTTIHKLLGLKEVISNKGIQSFEADHKDKSELSKYKYLIVDEVSMLDDKICTEILKYSADVKVIFMGDPAQIPPINRLDCIPFSDLPNEYTFARAELKEMMRQKGDHPIIDAAFAIRNNLTATHPIPVLATKINSSKHGIVYLNSVTDRGHMKQLLKTCFDNESFKNNANFAKIIAWRNNTVDFMNKTVREILFGNAAEPYVIGEKLIASGPIFKEMNNSKWGPKWTIHINTSEEMEITEIELTRKQFSEGSHKLTAVMYECDVKIWDPIDREFKTDTISIMHESSITEYKTLLETCKKIAIKLKDKSAWVTYFNIMKWNADVDYNYAITAHKCLPLSNKILTFEGIKLFHQFKKGTYIMSGKGNSKEIVDSVYTGYKPEYFIKTKSGRMFISSEEHKYLSNNGYVTASMLQLTDSIALWRNSVNHIFKFDLLYWVLGYLVGDGCYSYKSNRIDVTMEESCSAKNLILSFFNEFGKATVRTRKGTKTINIIVESKELRNKLLKLGLARVTKTAKTTPNFKTLNHQANFIRGLMDADGSCSKNKTCIRLVNISESVIDNVQLLLQQFGIISRKMINKIYSEKHNQSYTLSITGVDVLRYKTQIGFSIDYKAQYLDNICSISNGKTSVDFIPNSDKIIDYFKDLFDTNKTKGGLSSKGTGLYANKNRQVSYHLKYGKLSYHNLKTIIEHCEVRNIPVDNKYKQILNDWYFYDPIIECGFTGKTVEMMDIEVKDDHNFVYNGAVTHNSQGSTFTHVVLIEEDMEFNPRTVERNRIKYTAYSRPTNKLFILRKNYGS